jgi:protein-S-isoprenylcysteine O-methyltransferase Ste14
MSLGIKIALFLITSTGLVYISRASLRLPRSHGFYRFFAWEFILALLLVNVDAWFLQPLAWHQVISWLLLFICILPLVQGVRLLRKLGQQDPNRIDEATLGFEKTTRLVTSGIFRYIRHPLYCSLLLLDWGIFFKDPTWLAGFLAVLASLFLVATARRDEAENIRFFGPQYQEYMQKTKMFIPYLF